VTLQAVLTALLLPPLPFVLAALGGGLLAWRGGPRWRRAGGAVATLAAFGTLVLATPLAAGLLLGSLARGAADAPAGPPPAAIVVLSAEVVETQGGDYEPGPFSLERLRAGAALHRRTGLPVLVTGGLVRPGGPSLAAVLGRSLAEDFGVAPRWLEEHARDTRENATLGAAMLRGADVEAAYVVTHAWHMPRALEAFARTGFATTPAPLRHDALPDGRRLADWVPRADHLGTSWYALREWAGRLVYALRDGR
jgi:uncharacterized SAM-binding protein YcdF (DUF218 family)